MSSTWSTSVCGVHRVCRVRRVYRVRGVCRVRGVRQYVEYMEYVEYVEYVDHTSILIASHGLKFLEHIFCRRHFLPESSSLQCQNTLVLAFSPRITYLFIYLFVYLLLLFPTD